MISKTKNKKLKKREIETKKNKKKKNFFIVHKFIRGQKSQFGNLKEPESNEKNVYKEQKKVEAFNYFINFICKFVRITFFISATKDLNLCLHLYFL